MAVGPGLEEAGVEPIERTRWLRALSWSVIGWVLLSALWCVAALAHASLVGSSPSAGGELSAPPEQVRLRFSEPVFAEFDPVEVRDEGGQRVDQGDARVDPQDARAVVASLEELPEGSYEVRWRVTSLDGHVVEGRYGFAVAETEEEPPTGGQRGDGQEGGRNTGREPAEQEGTRDEPTPILAYSVLCLGASAGIVAAGYLASRLFRRHKP